MDIKKLLSAIFVAAIFLFLFFRIADDWHQIKLQISNFNFFTLIIAILMAIPVYFFNVLTWHILTQVVGLKISFKKNLKIWLMSNIARFLPGGFWQYPGRIYLLCKQGASKKEGSIAVLLEAILNIFVGVLIVALFFKLIWLFFLIVSILFLVYLFSKNKISTHIKIPILFFTILMQYFFAGLALFILANSVFSLNLNLLPTIVGIFTTSWLLGYITFFAPSGLGVQEASIATLLSPYIPFGGAGVLAIIFRVVLFLAEALVLAFVFILFDKLLDLNKKKLL